MVDVNLVKFSFTIPGRFKVKKDVTKYILRKSMSGFLPTEIIRRTKGGGYVHTAHSLLNETPLKELILNTIPEWNLVKKGYIKGGYIRNILARNVTPKLKRQYSLIIYLLSIEIWNNIYIEGDSVHKPKSKGLDCLLEPN